MKAKWNEQEEENEQKKWGTKKARNNIGNKEKPAISYYNKLSIESPDFTRKWNCIHCHGNVSFLLTEVKKKKSVFIMFCNENVPFW